MALTNSQYESILRAYDAKQSRDRERYMDKINRIYEKDPRLTELDAKIAEVSVAQAKSLLDGDAQAPERLKAQLAEIKRKKQTILSDLGYSEDDLAMEYECKDCRDTGYIDGEKCHCFKQAEIDLLYTQSNIRKIIEEENFDTFSLEYYSKTEMHPTLENMSIYDYAVRTLDNCKSFVEHFDEQHGNILLSGAVGVGKTFLTHCIAKELLESGHSVVYLTSYELFEVFEKHTFDKKSEMEEQIDHILNCDLLVVDDLGTEFANSFTVSQFFLLINERILRSKSTIISTNLSMDEIAEKYTERVFSRIRANYLTLMPAADDIRVQKRLKRK